MLRTDLRSLSGQIKQLHVDVFRMVAARQLTSGTAQQLAEGMQQSKTEVKFLLVSRGAGLDARDVARQAYDTKCSVVSWLKPQVHLVSSDIRCWLGHLHGPNLRPLSGCGLQGDGKHRCAVLRSTASVFGLCTTIDESSSNAAQGRDSRASS
jgi:hypothetical protein